MGEEKGSGVGAATIASEECKLFEDFLALHEETRGGGERDASVSGKRKVPCGCEDGEDLDSDDDDKVRSSRFAETCVLVRRVVRADRCLVLHCQWGERIKLVLIQPLECSQEITTKLIMEGLASAGAGDFESQSSARARLCSRA